MNSLFEFKTHYKTDDVIFFFIGLIAIFTSTIHDLLVASQIIYSLYFFPYGLVTFIAFQSVLIASRFSRAFYKAEDLTESLFATNFAIARFVPTQFLKLLGKENIADVQLGDHIQQEMTVFFCDVRGFTSLAENLSSEGVFRFLNEFFQKTINIINENHGFVNKIIGDGLLAIFPESPEDGLQAAIKISQSVQEWNEIRKQENLPSIKIGNRHSLRTTKHGHCGYL